MGAAVGEPEEDEQQPRAWWHRRRADEKAVASAAKTRSHAIVKPLKRRKRHADPPFRAFLCPYETRRLRLPIVTLEIGPVGAAVGARQQLDGDREHLIELHIAAVLAAAGGGSIGSADDRHMGDAGDGVIR